ncbi:Phage tail tape measure protein domain-containing protein [Hyphomicrobium sp. 1Nfss2.1]|uniref:hypothetical protein n=1 Tax=Hyphomicrobium sp. 1Nfss2.1 TaxID=3413936 RepID=UPI003C7DA4EC
MNVSIVLNLIDRMTGPARRVASTWKQTAQQVTAASRQMQSGSAGVVTSFKRAGAAAIDAAVHVNRYIRALTLAGKARGPGFASGAAAGRMLGSGGGGGLASWFTIPASFTAALDAAKAENKFRALVDAVTPEQMMSIRSTLERRMLASGDAYAELMGAAGDAAQIMGDAAQAANVSIAASKLKNVDTGGMTVSAFAESVAAIVKSGATLADINRLSDMLTMQQKLGAATAGGSIEAYKNVAAYKGLYKFDMAEMLTAIGLIKNEAPALEDSQIGGMAKYGLRLFNAPDESFKKRLRAANLKPSQFFTDGAFDIQKSQQTLHAMAQTEKGAKRLKELFSGKNVLAGQFWQMLAGIEPDRFVRYLRELKDSAGALEAADLERFKGLPGGWNKLAKSFWLIGRAIGDTLAPAVISVSNHMADFAVWMTASLNRFREAYPTVTKWAGAILGGVAAIRMLGFFLPEVTALGAWLVRLPLQLARLGVALGFGAFVGLGRLAVELGRMSGGLMRAGVAAGFAARAFKFMRSALFWGAAIEGATFLFNEWDRIVALFKNPLKVDIIWPEMPRSLQAFFKWAGGIRASNAEKAWESAVVGARDGYMAQQWHRARGLLGLNGAPRTADEVGPGGLRPLSLIYRDAGIPPVLQGRARDAQARSMASEGQGASPKGITVQANGPQVIFKQAPPSVNVTVNAVTNADAGAIGAAAGSAVGSALRSTMGRDGN